MIEISNDPVEAALQSKILKFTHKRKPVQVAQYTDRLDEVQRTVELLRKELAEWEEFLSEISPKSPE